MLKNQQRLFPDVMFAALNSKANRHIHGLSILLHPKQKQQAPRLQSDIGN